MEITEEEFQSFRPIKNPHGNRGWDGTMFETFGVELNFVRSQPDNKVWTLMNDDDGNLVITSGFHFVNRVGYFVTEESWTTDCFINLS